MIFSWYNSYVGPQVGILVFHSQNNHDKNDFYYGGQNHKQRYSYQTNGTTFLVMIIRVSPMKEPRKYLLFSQRYAHLDFASNSL